jgi:hypothetical protein
MSSDVTYCCIRLVQIVWIVLIFKIEMQLSNTMWKFMGMENTWARKKCSHSMVHSLLCKPNSPHQNNLCFYAIQTFSMLDPTPNQLNPIHTFKHYFLKIHFNIILQSTRNSGRNCIKLFLMQLQLLYYQLKNYDNTKN